LRDEAGLRERAERRSGGAARAADRTGQRTRQAGRRRGSVRGLPNSLIEGGAGAWEKQVRRGGRGMERRAEGHGVKPAAQLARHALALRGAATAR
jgi:hypothetical protein